MLHWFRPSFITLMGLLSLATTAWPALVPTQTTSIQPAKTLTPEEFVKVFIFIMEHYAGTAYTSPHFEGNTTVLFAGQCNNFTGPSSTTISSLKLYNSRDKAARCSIYTLYNCVGFPIITTKEHALPSLSGGFNAQSYKCDFYTPTIPQSGG